MNTTEETATKYFGVPDEFAAAENARVTVVPVPYEATVSYGKGTALGPSAVLKASQQVELFDEELWIEPHKVGIHTAQAVHLEAPDNEEGDPFSALKEAVAPLIEFDKFPILIGGEHSLTLGAVRACVDRYRDLSILQIDAHADCRDSYEGHKYSHASVAYHLYNTLPEPLITQVGIRNISAGEVEWMEQEKPRINTYWARYQDKWNFNEIINTLSDNVYLTIDVDGLDPSIMPATGTPEPGGMSWYQLMELIKQLCIKKNVVAADVVEFAPIANLHAPDFLVAKLIYKLIGYRFALELGVSKKYL